MPGAPLQRWNPREVMGAGADRLNHHPRLGSPSRGQSSGGADRAAEFSAGEDWTMNTKDMDAIAAAIVRIQNAIPGTHIDAFYRGDVEPSIVVVIPNVRIVDGRLVAVEAAK